MDRHWRTREDAFAEVWPELAERLELNPGLEAKTLFLDLQRRFPGRFADGQLRALQRRVKAWRASRGPAKEVFFDQVHYPGRLCASDFTRCGDLGVTIAGQPFDHEAFDEEGGGGGREGGAGGAAEGTAPAGVPGRL